MNIDSAFPSTYVKASDLGGKPARLVIRSVQMETVGSDQKPIMYFEKREKGMVLNRTNANTISMVYGTNTDDWVGGEVELFTAMVDFQGRSVEAIRVRIPPRKPAARQAAYDNGFDDMSNPAKQASNARSDDSRAFAPSGGGAPYDDEVPFAPEMR